MDQEITLGSTVKDKETPVTGLVTGVAAYLNRATIFQVTTRHATTSDGAPIVGWYEAGQLEVIAPAAS